MNGKLFSSVRANQFEQNGRQKEKKKSKDFSSYQSFNQTFRQEKLWNRTGLVVIRMFLLI